MQEHSEQSGGSGVDVSVVIPVYNEEDCVLPLEAELFPVLDGLARPYEVVFVDDGSTDSTREKLEQVKSRRSQVRIVRFKKNAGQTAAFDAGFKHARGAIVVTMDADLQNDPADIPNILAAAASGFDMVCGVRARREDSVVRRLSSRIANGIRNWGTRENIRDVGCSLKAFNREKLVRIKLFTGMHRFFPTLMRLEGASVTEVDVNHRPRKLGKSKYGIGNRAFRALRDLFAVRWMQERYLHYEVKQDEH
jgi:dolichol-phosphate mannosyltransferase